MKTKYPFISFVHYLELNLHTYMALFKYFEQRLPEPSGSLSAV